MTPCAWRLVRRWPLDGKRNWEHYLKPKYGNQKNFVGSEHLMIMEYVVGWEHARAGSASGAEYFKNSNLVKTRDQAAGASGTRRRRR